MASFGGSNFPATRNTTQRMQKYLWFINQQNFRIKNIMIYLI